MRCPSCGKENADDEKSCASCGTFLGPTLVVNKPSEDEVPTHLGLAVVAAGLPLLCATGGALALLAVPLGVYAVLQARSVEQHLAGRKRDVLAATAASINAQRFALLAIVLAVVLSVAHLAHRVTSLGDVVERDLATAEPSEPVEAVEPEGLEDPAPAEPATSAAAEVEAAPTGEEPAEDL